MRSSICSNRATSLFALPDTDTIATPRKITADYGYLRLRREDYQTTDIERWAEFARQEESNWKEAFVYFKHEESGIGPKLAQQMVKLLEPVEPSVRSK
jgi:uncharacterized protein YecE (DUF72 family)